MTAAWGRRIPSAAITFFLPALAIVIAVLWAYSSAIPNGFLYGDDEHIIVKNQFLPHIRLWPKFFTENLKAGFGQVTNFYRPLQLLSYALLAKAYGLTPWVFHLYNVLLHALNGIFLFALLRVLFSAAPFWVPALSAALWALHPLQVEDISGINGTATPLHFTFILMSALGFIRTLRDKTIGLWWWLSLGSFAGALLSKEAAIVLPALLGALHWAIKQEKEPWPEPMTLVRLHGPFWLWAVGYVLLRLTLLNFGGTLDFYSASNIYTEHLSYRLYTLLTVLGHGLSLCLWPRGLHPERSWPVYASPWQAPVWISAAVFTALVLLAWRLRKRLPYLSLGIAWFFISYTPMSNLAAKINSLFWEHWLYVPTAGLVISLTALIARDSRIIKIFAVAASCLAASSAWATHRRHYFWKNSETYFRYVLSHEPQSAKLWNNLAMALVDRGDLAQAVDSYQKALALEDSYPEVHHNLGQAYLSLGRIPEARVRFERALVLNPAFYHSHLALARLDAAAGNVPGAIGHLEAALATHPYLDGTRQALEQLKRVR